MTDDDQGTPPVVLWFRRDLRLNDHEALVAAAATGRRVVPVFIVDPVLWANAGDVRRACLSQALSALDQSLRTSGGQLIVRTGAPAEQVLALAQEVGATDVFVTGDFTPYGRNRDARVAAVLDKDGRALHEVGAPYAVTPGAVRKSDGTPFRVFTPYYRGWCAHGWSAPMPSPAVTWAAAPSEAIPDHRAPTDTALPEVSEAAALDRWAAFRQSGLTGYHEQRDRADLAATSQASMDLRWGLIHPRTLLADLGDSKDHDHFRREVCWREFYADVLFHEPASARRNLKVSMDAMRTDNGEQADVRFAAWAEGRTGYPFVDAGMRQLRAEGWVHNRVRMVVASFLVKDLHLDWQRGAAHFMQWLRDGDIASNQHGWQWTAGTGTDAAPYFRIFNPVAQGQRFDPDGDYVRRYIPELRGIDGAAVHEPWLAPLLAPDYPAPIIEHAAERQEALARLAEVTGSASDAKP